MNRKTIALTVAAAILAGCTLDLDYQRPDLPIVAARPDGPAYKIASADQAAGAALFESSIARLRLPDDHSRQRAVPGVSNRAPAKAQLRIGRPPFECIALLPQGGGATRSHELQSRIILRRNKASGYRPEQSSPRVARPLGTTFIFERIVAEIGVERCRPSRTFTAIGGAGLQRNA